MHQHLDFQLLEHLHLNAPARLGSPLPGPKLGSTYGASTEFVDYRPYHPGDDIRTVDWSLYARLGKRFVRLFRAEAQLDVHLLLDTSNSMRFGTPAKLAYAKRMVAALSYVGLRQLDRVGLATFTDSVQQSLPPQRGQQQLAHLFERLDAVQPAGSSDFNRALKAYAVQATTAGLAIIVSDFFAATGYEIGLYALLYKKFHITVIHILDDAECAPHAAGSVNLCDLESDARLALTLDADVIKQYRVRMEAFVTTLRNFCRRHRFTYVQLRTSWPFADSIRRLQQEGVWY